MAKRSTRFTLNGARTFSTASISGLRRVDGRLRTSNDGQAYAQCKHMKRLTKMQTNLDTFSKYEHMQRRQKNFRQIHVCNALVRLQKRRSARRATERKTEVVHFKKH